MNILVIRNDKLGDFMLIYPALLMLRTALPHAKIVALCPAYTADLANACPYIDAVILDDDHLNAASLKAWQFDVQISFFSSKKVAKLGRAAQIATRIAPATKLWQFYYNHRVVQRRSRSLKAEYQYNLDLVIYLLKILNKPIPDIRAPYWYSAVAPTRRQQFLAAQHLKDAVNIFVHAGSGGSANNLDLAQYAQLINALATQLRDWQAVNFILSAGPGELANAQQLAARCQTSCHVYHSDSGMVDFADNLAAAADVFIAGSTGTLHLAGVLDVATVGFYPATRACCARRWQTCASHKLEISAEPASPNDMHSIDIPKSAHEIAEFIQNLP